MPSKQLISQDQVLKFKEIYNSGNQKCFPLLKPNEFKDVILTKNSRYEYISNVPKRFDYSLSFCWGYCGTGPIDLGLSILLHFTNEDLAFTYLHALDFTLEVIAKLPQSETVIKAEVILLWLEKAKSRKNVDGFTTSLYQPRLCPQGFIYHEGNLLAVPTDPKPEPNQTKTILQRRF
jgi:hypothetical protein